MGLGSHAPLPRTCLPLVSVQTEPVLSQREKMMMRKATARSGGRRRLVEGDSMPLDTRRVVCAGAHVALCTSLFLEQHKRPRKVVPRTLGSEGSCHTLSPHQAAAVPWQVPQFLAITEWQPGATAGQACPEKTR